MGTQAHVPTPTVDLRFNDVMLKVVFAALGNMTINEAGAVHDEIRGQLDYNKASQEQQEKSHVPDE